MRTKRKSIAGTAAPEDLFPQPEPFWRVLLVSLVALSFLLGCSPMADFDVWWHLRTGQLILETRAVPRIDLFSYTSAGRPWIDIHWLYQVGLALLYQMGGASALVLLKAAAGSGIVALSMLARRPDHRTWPLPLAWLPSILLVSGRLSERPELISLVLIAAYLSVLARAPQAARWLWLLPALQALWVNCHGFFVMGPLLLLAYAIEWGVDELRAPASAVARRPPKIFAAVVAATVLGCFANPYGAKAIALSIEQYRKIGTPGLYRGAIGELKSTGDFVAAAGIWNPYLLAYFAALLLGVWSFVLSARRARFRLFRALIFAAGAYLAWRASRNTGLFGVIAAFVTTGNLDDALAAPASRSAATLRKPGRRASGRNPTSARQRPHPNVVLLVAVVALAIATASGALYAWAGEGRRFALGERSHWFAHDACAFLARADMPERVVAYNIGQAAVCIAHGAPAHKQFMDPRLEVNTAETFERYMAGMQRLWRNDADWEQALAIDYRRPEEIPALLIERGPLGRAAENLMHDSRWRCVFADGLATVFVSTRFAEMHQLPVVVSL